MSAAAAAAATTAAGAPIAVGPLAPTHGAHLLAPLEP